MFWFTIFEIEILVMLIIATLFYLSSLKWKKVKSESWKITEKLIYNNSKITIYLLILSVIILLLMGIYLNFWNFDNELRELYFFYSIDILLFFSFIIPWYHWFINRKKIKDKFFHINNTWWLILWIVCLLSIFWLYFWYLK